MPIHLQQEEGGTLLGQREADQGSTRPSRRSLTSGSTENFRVLFDMTDFEGWESGAMWEEIKFDLRHFADIERLAVVGDTKR